MSSTLEIVQALRESEPRYQITISGDYVYVHHPYFSVTTDEVWAVIRRLGIPMNYVIYEGFQVRIYVKGTK